MHGFLPLLAGRRDWIRRRRAEAVKIASVDPITSDASLANLLGIPEDVEQPQRSSITDILKIEREEELLEEEPEEESEEIPQEITESEQALHAIAPSIPSELSEEEFTTLMDSSDIPEEDSIEFYFENADLQNFVQQIEDVFEVKFISEDALDPLPQGSKSLKGNKISYRTHRPISRAQAWNTFNTFLNIAGFAIIPQPDPRVYRITTIARAQKSPLVTYIGTSYEMLPDSDELIRYVYFVENNTVEAIRTVIEQFRSSSSQAVYLNEHKGFILTDIAYNIKKLMEVIKELDKVSVPESLSVLKLRRADAKQVKELYDMLVQSEQPNKFGPRVLPKKQPSALSLPENVTIVAEPRTNSLILLGPKNARENIEQFIIKNIDVELDQAYSPVRTYQLRYANAETMAEIMNNVTKFGGDTEAGKSGGVRGGDQYLRPMSFIAEPKTNQLIIRGHYEDFLKAEKIIKQLDEDQPQVAIEVLILSITATNQKEIGSQLRSKIDDLTKNSGGWDGLLGNNIKFQTSGLFAGSTTASGIQQNTTNGTPGVQRLLGNLINLVTNASVGNTIITLGQDLAGVWGILQLLETVSNVQLVSNPFLIATNKTPAEVSLGETRRVATATVAGATNSENIQAFGDEKANLVVQITPQITSDGMIVMDLDITIDTFINNTNLASANKNTKKIHTSAILADKQVLALGGLVRHQVSNNMNKVPILGDIPVLGWFFKNKQKVQNKQNLLVLVSARIIEPTNAKELTIYNNKHIDEYRTTLNQLQTVSDNKDPIHRLFFTANEDATEKEIDDYLFNRKKRRNHRRRRSKEKIEQKVLSAETTLEKNDTLITEKVASQAVTKTTETVTKITETTPKPKIVSGSPTTTSKNMVIASAPSKKNGPTITPQISNISQTIEQKNVSTSSTPTFSDNTPKSSSSDSLLAVLKTKKRTDLSVSNMLKKSRSEGVKT